VAQIARPDGDQTIGNWEDQAAGTTNIYQSIDEAVASDTDYIQSDESPSASAYECSLSDVNDPESASAHVVSYRYQKSGAGGTVNLVVGLYQGASEIASNTHNNIGNTWTAGTLTLSSGEADSITDYTDLRIRFTATQA